ncbi:ImmA/IrrE family metallo-endopeptidase [Porphyromonas catoniae]|uniref:ImmA/IrrE family metallo-endopeptidase n=1 Tax=Porphyromonas catoniae TaxID=41976 RepID=UPI00069354C7|nr:ImmA/IrrE family metallo-endopeptidase [Porphyromonas catoniae]
MEMLGSMEIMGVRGVRRPKSSPAGDLDVNLLFTSVDSLLGIASQKELYDGDSLDILKLIELRDDLRVEFVSLDSAISGKLSRDGDKWVISVNKGHSRNRQRFTLAHELAHYVLHKSEKESFTDTVFFRGMSVNNIEYAANDFAAKLLMPEDRVRRLVREGVASVETLAESFGVSVAAMLYRVKQLGFRTKA